MPILDKMSFKGRCLRGNCTQDKLCPTWDYSWEHVCVLELVSPKEKCIHTVYIANIFKLELISQRYRSLMIIIHFLVFMQTLVEISIELVHALIDPLGNALSSLCLNISISTNIARFYSNVAQLLIYSIISNKCI